MVAERPFATTLQHRRLRHNDVWRREQHRQSCYDSEQRKYNKAQSIDHHRRELPVLGDVRRLIFLAKLIRDKSNLFQDQSEFVVGPDARMIRHQALV